MRHIQGQNYIAEQMRLAQQKPRPLVRFFIAGLISMAIGLTVVSIPTFWYGYLAVVHAEYDSAVAALIVKSAILIGGGILAFGALLYYVSLSLMGEYSSRMTLKRIITIIQGQEYNRLKAGQDGEKAVKQVLSSLDDQWTLFSGVILPGMYGDIDHVLVGPLGLFAIECKHYSGHITYDDNNGIWTRVNHRNPDGEVLKDPAEQLLSVTRTLRKALNMAVIPVVVFTNDRASISGEHPQSTVLILSHLLPWIRSQRQCLTGEEAQQIVRALTQLLQQ